MTRRTPTSPAEDAERRAWHATESADVEAALETSPAGLARPEAARRLSQVGPNRLAEPPGPSPIWLFVQQFRSPLIYILLLAFGVTVLLGEYLDAIVIGVVLVLNAVIGFTQERRAAASVRSLMQLVAPRAHVIREGREWSVEGRELVPGDLVLLESGARVPADLRLVVSNGLEIDESLLTGESVPVGKATARLPARVPLAERSNLAFAGTVVSRGRGRGYVVATGGQTELGAIAAGMRGQAEPATPLQRRLDRLAKLLGGVVAVAAAIAFAVGLLRGMNPTDLFIAAVALAVSAVPEGLPVAFTITLTIGVRRMARRNAIVRHLPAVETLGSTTTIGSDKTGTLTENRMTVQAIWAGGETYSPPSTPAGPAPGLATALGATLLAGVLTSEAKLYRQGDALEAQGDPTEAALLVAAARFGLDPAAAHAEYERLFDVPFEAERQYSATVRARAGEVLLFLKGSPERVLAMCDDMIGPSGRLPLDRSAVQEAVQQLAARGLRVLAMAYRRLETAPASPDRLPGPAGLTLTGLQGMLDPPRAGVRDAIRGCQDAGIRVVMITGDHALTARAIGREIGLAGIDAPILSGEEVAGLSDQDLRAQVREVAVYARVVPEDKLRIVNALRAQGEVVAITGDGVNDAPALKAADIGIAMGRGGTDVAREAADMVLADDNFVSIYSAVEEGRVTFENLRKVTLFLVSTGVAEVITIVGALLLGLPLPLLAAQILWLNLVTEGLQHIALAVEPAEPGVLQRPPRDPREGIISPLLWERIFITGVVMAAGTLGLFLWELGRSGSLQGAQSVALTTMVLYQAFQLGNARSERRSVFGVSLFSNPLLLVAAGGSLLVHVLALYLPPTQLLLRVQPPDLQTWLWMVAVAATVVVAVELHKLARRGRA